MASMSAPTASRTSPTIRPSYITSDPIGEGEQLLELLGDQQDRRSPSLAQVEQQLVDALDGADVQAARRLDGDEHLRRRVDLAGEDQALEIAARQEPRRRIDRGRGDRVRLAQSSALSRAARVVEQPATGQRRLAVRASGSRLSTSDRLGALPTPVRSSGTCATPARSIAAPGGRRDRGPSIVTRPGARPQPGDDLGELGLAVAGDGGDADDLAGTDLERRRRGAPAGRGRCRRGRRRPESTTRPGSTAVRSRSRGPAGRPSVGPDRLA